MTQAPPTSAFSFTGSPPVLTRGTPSASHSAPPPAAPGDYELIQETKNQIRMLVQEITQLSHQELSLPDFWERFLSRVVSAMASVGGAIWSVENNGQLHLHYQVNLAQAGLDDDPASAARHQHLLRKMACDAQAGFIPPQTGGRDSSEPGNPTDCLLVIAPIVVEQGAEFLLEIFQYAGGGPTTHRGYVRFLVQMSELAANFIRNRRLRRLGSQQSLWDDMEQFLAALYGTLDTQATAYTLANDGRLLAECDRLSVLVNRSEQWQLTAVSGVERVDRRTVACTHLERLAQTVAATGAPVWYHGPDDSLAPQIRDAIQKYLEHTHAVRLGVVPLVGAPSSPEADRPPARPSAVLVVEQFRRGEAVGLAERVEVLVRHGAIALAKAREFERHTWLPLARWRSRLFSRGGKIRRRLWAAAGGALLLAGLAFLPVEFHVSAAGTLQPAERYEVFAAVDGVVQEVAVQHGQQVQPQEVLVRLTNPALDLEITSVEGQLRTTQERIRSLRHEQLIRSSRPVPGGREAGELAELLQTAQSLQRQLALLQQKAAQLEIRSPHTGQVVTWQVKDRLLRRPVERGESLLTLVNPQGPWELELALPERRVGHVTRGLQAASGALPVTFRLATHPQQTLSGRLMEMHRVVEAHRTDEPTVLLRVAFDARQLPQRQADVSALARIECGRQPLVYVVFCDLIETIHSRILFWL